MSSSDQNLLDADPFGFGRFAATPERKVIVLWDYENCPVPKGVSGLSAIRNIREAALKFGSIDQFEAYCDWSNESNTGIRSDLSISGVKLRDCPKKGWIGTVDKTIIIDMMVYALECARTTTIFLISGDRDHAYAISTLRNRGYPVKLLAPTGTLHSGLQVLADLLDWNSIFKSDLPPAELLDFSALAGGEEEETDEEDVKEDETSDEEDEDEDSKREEEEAEAEETAQVHVGLEAGVNEVAQIQAGMEAGVEDTAQVQVEAEEKMQMSVEIAEEADSREAALPTPLQSEPVTALPPAGIPFTWVPAEPGLPSIVVPLEPLSARAQEELEEPPKKLEEKPREKREEPPLPSTLPSSSHPTQPQTLAVSPSHGGGSSRPGSEESVLEQPLRYVPPKFEVLVEELDTLKEEGVPEPTWSVICIGVKQRCPTILRDVGVKRWKDYMLLAEKDGIVRNTKKPSGIEAARLII